MKVAIGMQQIIWAGFATAAMVSASVPALGWSVWPDFDFDSVQPASAPARASVEVLGPTALYDSDGNEIRVAVELPAMNPARR